jgi:hypothetical protein
MAAAAALPPPPSIPNTHMASKAHNCPNCGENLPSVGTVVEDAQRKIRELEAQVEFLKEKATAAGMFWSHFTHRLSAALRSL